MVSRQAPGGFQLRGHLAEMALLIIRVRALLSLVAPVRERIIFPAAMKTSALLSTLALTTLLAASAHAAIKTETIEYKDGDATLEGFLAYDDANTKARPGVLVVHDWTCVQDYAKSRAKQLA